MLLRQDNGTSYEPPYPSRYHAPTPHRPLPASSLPAPLDNPFEPSDNPFEPSDKLSYVYPPSHQSSLSSVALANETRDINRTPSPTQSEAEALRGDNSFWKKARKLSYWKSKEGVIMIATLFIGVAITVGLNYGLLALAKVVVPHRHQLSEINFSGLIPVVLLIIVSFPPLFGHELIAPMCAIVYGLWGGFIIVCVGTLLGEIANFMAFKYSCRGRTRKWQMTNIRYGTIAEATRLGGFRVMLGARYTLLPPHILTPIFATSNVNFWWFLLAATLALPRQFVVVFSGTFLQEQTEGHKVSKHEKIKATVIQLVALAVTLITTYFAGKYINGKMDAVRPQIIYARRKARQAHPDMFPKKKGQKISNRWHIFDA